MLKKNFQVKVSANLEESTLYTTVEITPLVPVASVNVSMIVSPVKGETDGN